jgi:hypothetical protein
MKRTELKRKTPLKKVSKKMRSRRCKRQNLLKSYLKRATAYVLCAEGHRTGEDFPSTR